MGQRSAMHWIEFETQKDQNEKRGRYQRLHTLFSPGVYATMQRIRLLNPSRWIVSSGKYLLRTSREG